VSEKIIRRIIKEGNLVVPNIKRKKYSSYKGEISPEVENIVNRDFYSDRGCHYHWPGWMERTEKAEGLHAQCTRKATYLITLPMKAFVV